MAKTYRITRGQWVVTVDADNGKEAQYKAGQALDLFKRTGRKPSGADIKHKD